MQIMEDNRPPRRDDREHPEESRGQIIDHNPPAPVPPTKTPPKDDEEWRHAADDDKEVHLFGQSMVREKSVLLILIFKKLFCMILT